MIYDIYSFIIGFHKTLYFNFKFFKIKEAIKLPVFISHKVNFRSLRGIIKIEAPISRGMIKIGFGNVAVFDRRYSRSILELHGTWVIKGNCYLGHGSKISVGENGYLEIGDNFTISAESAIICHKKIIIGNDCLFSWDIQVMDTDFHKIFIDNKQINLDEPIFIGNSIWIGCRSLILKGASIPDNCIIGASSMITKKLQYSNSVYTGNDSKPKKENVRWEM